MSFFEGKLLDLDLNSENAFFPSKEMSLKDKTLLFRTDLFRLRQKRSGPQDSSFPTILPLCSEEAWSFPFFLSSDGEEEVLASCHHQRRAWWIPVWTTHVRLEIKIEKQLRRGGRIRCEESGLECFRRRRVREIQLSSAGWNKHEGSGSPQRHVPRDGQISWGFDFSAPVLGWISQQHHVTSIINTAWGCPRSPEVGSRKPVRNRQHESDYLWQGMQPKILSP